MEKPSIEQRIAAIASPEAPVEAPKEPEAPVEVVEEVVEETAQPVEAAEVTESEVAEESSDDAIELRTLSDVAKHLNIDIEDLYSIEAPISEGDGKTKNVPFAELKDVYQGTSQKINKAYAEAVQAREEIKAQAEHARQQTERSVLEAASLTEEAERRLTADMEQINWAQLREDDPSEWAARRQELGDRQRQIQEAKQRVQAAFEQHVETQQASAAEASQEHLARERDMLVAAIPEWRNEKVMTQEIAEMRDYLARSGFQTQEIDGVTDHRVIVMLRKAQAYEAQQDKVATAKKQVVKVGKKTIRPGTATSKQQQQTDRHASMRQALRKSGSTDDAARLIAARRQGS